MKTEKRIVGTVICALVLCFGGFAFADTSQDELLDHIFAVSPCRNVVGFNGDRYRGAAIAFIDEADHVGPGDVFFVLAGSSVVARAVVTDLIPASRLSWAFSVATRSGFGIWKGKAKPRTKPLGFKAVAVLKSDGIDLGGGSDMMLGILGIPFSLADIGKRVSSKRTSWPEGKALEANKPISTTRETWLLPHSAVRCVYTDSDHYPEGNVGNDGAVVSLTELACPNSTVRDLGYVRSIISVGNNGRYLLFLGGGKEFPYGDWIAVFDGKSILARRLLLDQPPD